MTSLRISRDMRPRFWGLLSGPARRSRSSVNVLCHRRSDTSANKARSIPSCRASRSSVNPDRSNTDECAGRGSTTEPSCHTSTSLIRTGCSNCVRSERVLRSSNDTASTVAKVGADRPDSKSLTFDAFQCSPMDRAWRDSSSCVIPSSIRMRLQFAPTTLARVDILSSVTGNPEQ